MKNTLNLSELKALLKKAIDIEREQVSMNRMEKDAQQALKEAAESGSLESETTQRRIGDARLKLDTIKMRRDALTAPEREIQKGLYRIFSQQSEAWNDLVVAKRTEMEEAIIKANLPFWGNERDCRRHFDAGEINLCPVMHDIRRAFYQKPSGAGEVERSITDDVELLIAHIRRHSRILGIQLNEPAE